MIRAALYILLFVTSCAQVKPLTGGFEDTIPPNIIRSLPDNFSTNQKEPVFVFEFDEIVDVSKLKEKLIISPYYDGSFEIKSKKNTLSLIFDSAFNENTTYIFNFADGLVDITEGNAAVKSRFVFSTGDKIDSSFVSGVVTNPLKNQVVEGALVGLYQKKDSIDLFHTKPTYFSFTDENGFFIIENIKAKDYTIYSYQDENKNFKSEYKKESFGFINNLISVDSFVNKVHIPLYAEDLTTLKVQAKRDKGDVFDITYSKKVESLVVLSDENINWSLNDNNLLRFYKKNLEKDSSLVVVRANDKVGYEITDSVYVSFSGNQKRDFKLDLDIDWSSQNIDDTVLFTMSFNLPLIKTEFKVDVLIDTVLIPEKFFYNKVISLENNKIIGEFAVLIDSVELFLKNKREKVIKDSLGFENDSIYRVVSGYYKRLNPKIISFLIPKGEFISITKDTLGVTSQELRVRGKDYYGDFSGEVKGVNKNKKYFVELVDENFSTIYKNEILFPFFSFKSISPGKYYLRVVNDVNDNFEWDYFGIKSKRQAERVFYYQEEIEIRSNWSVEDVVFDVEETVDNMFLVEK
ncbi:MAG: hypothetical protein CMB87_00955 [Flammeovirgaceae bacterium]|nr:hypothetical protein [Flammeovirgaceae bacterium]